MEIGTTRPSASQQRPSPPPLAKLSRRWTNSIYLPSNDHTVWTVHAQKLESLMLQLAMVPS